MNRIKLVGLIVLAALTTGCASPIALHYSPSSTMIVEGALKVGDFKYLPSENNSDIEPNQIRNTALVGSFLMEKNVDEYFETALFTESRSIGIKVKDSDNVVSGEIIEFLIDDLGFSIDWTLEVRYLVSDRAGSECYNKIHKIEKNASKYINPFGALNKVIKLNIEKAFADSDFIACIPTKT